MQACASVSAVPSGPMVAEVAPRPVLKWPGGKWQLRGQYAPLLPRADEIRGAYREVSVGGGALFFAFYASVRPAFLGDINPDLVNLYALLRDDVEGLLDALRRHQGAFSEAVAQANAALAASPNTFSS